MAEYINFPITTDQESLAQTAIDYLQSKLPDWEANPGSFEMWLIEAFSALAADTRDVSSDVPASIFRYFGAKLVGIIPIDSTTSTVDSTWTAIDTAGYEIEEGTVVSIRNSTGEEIPFEVITSVIILPGSSSTSVGGVSLISVNEGAETAGLGGNGIEASLVDPLDFITTVVLTGTTQGGLDAEEDETYLARLSERLQLLADRPILSSDFAIMAKQIAGADRVLAIDNFIPGTNEKQTIVHTATAGTFTLTWNAQTTAAINWNDNAATIQTRFENLSNVLPGEILVTGGPLPATVTLEWIFTKGISDQAAPTIGTNSLTGGGGAGSLVITTTVPGVAPVTNAERAVGIVAIDSTGLAVGSPIKTEIDTLLQSKREVNFLVNVFDPIYNTIAIVFTAKCFAAYDPVDVETRAEAAVAEYYSPATWGSLPFGDQKMWIKQNVLRYFDVVQVLSNVEGLDFVQTLTINGGTVDVTLVGSVPLPALTGNTITGTVTSP